MKLNYETWQKKIWPSIKDYTLMMIGVMIYGLGYQSFIVSNELVSGGGTGIAALIFYSTGIPIPYTYFAFNAVLLLVAFKTLGGKFIFRTLIGVAGLTASLELFSYVINEPPIQGEPFMSITIGALLCGTGLGMIFTSNGSTGGTDIIAAIINKYKHISLGQALLLFDIFIIGSSYILFHSIEKIVYGLVFMMIEIYVLDLVVNGIRQSVQFFIFSKEYDKIADRINQELDRGVTVLKGQGWYSKSDKPVLIVIAKKTESKTIFRIVKQEDPNAFVSQSLVKGVYGEGFDHIKS